MRRIATREPTADALADRNSILLTACDCDVGGQRLGVWKSMTASLCEFRQFPSGHLGNCTNLEQLRLVGDHDIIAAHFATISFQRRFRLESVVFMHSQKPVKTTNAPPDRKKASPTDPPGYSSLDAIAPVSPFSTGPGGQSFEIKVAVSYIARMLCNLTARGCEPGVIRAVKLQQRNRGRDVDDIHIVFDKSGGEADLFLTVKHALRLTAADQDLADALQQCWKQYRRADFDRSRHRLGIAFGERSNISKVRDNLFDVLTWAGTSESTASYLAKVSAFKEKARIVTVFSSILSAHAHRQLSDEEVWRFLQVFVAIPFDISESSSRDYVDIINVLHSIVPDPKADRASILFEQLFAKTLEVAKDGGELDVSQLAVRLPTDIAARLPTAALAHSRSIFSRLRDNVSRELTRQQSSRKYIPRLFVESSRTKDLARIFSNPTLFFKKCVEETRQLNCARINRICTKFGLPLVGFELPADFQIPSDLRDVDHAAGQLATLCGSLIERFEGLTSAPAALHLPAHDQYVLREQWHSLGTYSFKHKIERLQKHFHYLEGGVLLLLSPAGQGKTNFVCNFAEMTQICGIPALLLTGKGLRTSYRTCIC